MLLNSYSSYKKVFGSDIFNRNPAKPETHHPQKKVFTQTLQKTKNDVFNTPEITTQVFSQNPKPKGIRTFYFPTDIFNTQSQNTIDQNRDNRNASNKSSIFNGLSSKDYIVKKNQEQKFFDPQPYYGKESARDRMKREFYTNDSLFTVNFSSDQIPKPKEEKKETKSFIEQNNPIRKRFEWTHMNSADNKVINKDNANQSNIFNSPKYERNNKVITVIELKKKKKDEDYKKNWAIVRTKWPKSKLEWDNPLTEIAFKQSNNKQQENLTAFERKQNDLGHCPFADKVNTNTNISYKIKRKSNSVDYDDNSKDLMKIGNIYSMICPNPKKDKERKYIDMGSSVGFDDKFYMRNAQYKNVSTGENENVFEFRVNSKNSNIDSTEIRKILHEQGIHAYKVSEDVGVFDKDNIKFKIRDNNTENFSKVQEKLKKEKGIEIEPVQKIVVRRKKYENNTMSIWDKQLYFEEDYKGDKIVQKRLNGKNRISNMFLQINQRYKNQGLKEV